MEKFDHVNRIKTVQKGIWSKVCKPNNFESHNSLNLNFINFPGLGSNFVGCELFLGLNSPKIQLILIISLWETLIWKDSGTHMHGLGVYVKEVLLFHGNCLQKTWSIFDWLYFIWYLIFFPSIDHHLLCAQLWWGSI